MSVTGLRPRREFGRTVATDVTYRLRQEIVGGKLPPGEPLRFDALRSAFGVSFTTLREALTALVAEGLVLAEEQRGFRVAPISARDLAEVTDARVLIEVEVMRRSIEKGNDDWEMGVVSTLHRLSRIEERAVDNPLNDPEWNAAHRQFHEALVSAADSQTLLAIRATLFERASRYRYLSANLRTQPRDKVGEHRAIMQAAIARNSDLAVKLIERHIRSTTENVKKYAAHLLVSD
jgi:GntR family carbon starvation induced transcriptional regulator